MSEVVANLSTEEATCLMAMKEGAGLLDLGPYSRWHEAINSLVNRGYAKSRDVLTFDPKNPHSKGCEYVITDAGRRVCDDWENQSIRDLIGANNAVALSKQGWHVRGFSEKQVDALANFYWKMTGRNPSEICPP